jgi:carboxyl-terminal processing protease
MFRKKEMTSEQLLLHSVSIMLSLLAILKRMTRHCGLRLLTIGFGVSLLWVPPRADGAAAPASPEKPAASARPNTNDFRITPGPNDGRIAFWAAELLERIHYSHHPFDATISAEFLDRYLEVLDPQHLHFVQSDLTEFERYRTNLDHLTITPDGVADVTPAFVVFSRFVGRLKQHVDYTDELLQHEEFKFDSDDRIILNRREAPYPQDLSEARRLWRQRLRYDYLQEKLALEEPDKPKADSSPTADGKTIRQQIVETLSHRYHRNVRMFTDWNNEDVMGIYLTALANVYDPHSDYFNRAQLGEFEMGMNLQMYGIGAELRSEDGYCKINRLLPGPAAKSKKIKEGDRIIAVAQSNQAPVDIVDMSLNKVVQLIRGPKGSEVRLTIIPPRDPSIRTVISLIRDEITLEDQAAKGKIIELPVEKGKAVRLGVIDLPAFYAPMEMGVPKPRDLAGGGGGGPAGPYTSVDVTRLLDKFKRENVNGVILDLRRNGGGSLEEAIRLTGLFIKEGPVVQVVRSDGYVRVERDRDPSTAYDGPLIILTSRFSASASEIVAGALQDYGRAIVVGDSSTFGKGTVQNLDPLRMVMRLDKSDTNDPGALKITISKFYRASGASTQKRGVLPDIVLPSVLNYWKDIGESSLEHSLQWDTIPSAGYEKLNLVQPYLSELLGRSTARIATNRDFVYIREDIEQYRKLEADKTVSLNEKQRLQEKNEAEAREKARKKERLTRPQPDEKVYEITLKTVDLPGLPPPVQRTNALALKGEAGETAVPGTNSAVASAGLPENPAADSDELKPPTVDADLAEAERIMMDYISLLPKDSPLLATQTAPRN